MWNPQNWKGNNMGEKERWRAGERESKRKSTQSPIYIYTVSLDRAKGCAAPRPRFHGGCLATPSIPPPLYRSHSSPLSVPLLFFPSFFRLSLSPTAPSLARLLALCELLSISRFSLPFPMRERESESFSSFFRRSLSLPSLCCIYK